MCRFRSPYNLHIHTHQKTFNFPSNLFIRNHTQIIYWLDWRIWSVIARNEQNRFLVVLSSQRFFFFFYLFFSLFFLNLTKLWKNVLARFRLFFVCHSGYEKPHLTLSKLHAHIVWSLSHISFFSLFFVCHSKWCQCQKPPTSIPVFFPLFLTSLYLWSFCSWLWCFCCYICILLQCYWFTINNNWWSKCITIGTLIWT